jgi:hypothetical protein
VDLSPKSTTSRRGSRFPVREGALGRRSADLNAIAPELPGERGRRRGTEDVAEHEDEDGGRGLIGARPGESGRLIDSEAVVIVAGLAGSVHHVGAEGLHEARGGG